MQLPAESTASSIAIAEPPAGDRAAPPTRRLSLAAQGGPLLRAIRPKQWLKNGLVFLALIFSIDQAWTPLDPGSWAPLLLRAVLAFVAFSAVASAAYLVNDLGDIERDRLHPKKRRRPLAAGTLLPRTAVGAAALLIGGGALIGVAIGPAFALALAGYLALTFAYSYVLKHIVLVDLLGLAIGFVIRAVAGALAIGVPVSPWLYLCTLLGALFAAIAKRRHELVLLDDSAAGHRPILAEYTTGLLDQMASVVTSSTVVAYALYTVTAENLPDNHAMLATVPFVLYGIFRYMYLVHRHDKGGSPEEVLLTDRPLQVTVLLWAAVAMTILTVSRG